jgi:RHS repeat-associated protein
VAGASSVYSPEGTQILNLGDNTIWDPRQFALTVEDGTVYQIDQDLGVTQMMDRHGNTLTIEPTGIVSSLGPSVTFVRDAENRITSITDLNGKSMTYAFDDDGDLVTFTDRASNVTTFTYNPNHYLRDIYDPLGRRPIRNDYDASGRLLDQIDAHGNPVTYAADIDNNLDVVTDRLGRVTQYQYNQNGDITLKIDPTGAKWKSTYDQYGNTLTSTDPLGHTTTSTYDGARNLLTRTDPLGRTTTYTYNAFGQVLTTKDPLGRVTTNTYDASGNLASVTYPLAVGTDVAGATTTYEYDEQGDKLTEQDALGNITKYAYDLTAHRLIKMTDALGNVMQYTYDGNGKKLTESGFRNGYFFTNKYAYDAMGRLVSTTLPATGGTTSTRSTTYTLTGKVATSTDELNRVTSYTYDDLDRLTVTTRPDLTTETQTYDAEGQRTSSTDAAGNTTTYEYDGAGRLVHTHMADGSVTTTAYDPAGRATESIDELGNVRWSAYDDAGQLVGTTDAVGNTTAYAYDGAGNQILMLDPAGNLTQTTYDARNRAIAVTHPDGTTEKTAYDLDGRVTSRTDALGHTTQFAYDAAGRLTTVTDALGHATSYSYNEQGQRTLQTDANHHQTQFVIDVYTGRNAGRILPDFSQETLTYDLAGELTQRKDFLQRTTTYAYDAMGRLKSRTYPDNSGVSFTYTPDGRTATVTDARGVTTYAYDSRRRLSRITQPDGSRLDYAYDNRGSRTGVTATVGGLGLTTTSSYDADGRLSSVTDPTGRVFAVTYDANSRRSQLTFPNGTTTSYAYDVNNRLTGMTTVDTNGPPPPLTVASFAYTLDLAGKRTKVVEADGTTRSYAYDSVDRLTSETVTGALSYVKTFTYDSVGNRTQQVTTGTGAATVPYTYDSRDRMLTADGTSYTYDANGNELTNSAEAGYSYDFENRLTKATMSAGGNVAYVYDADGNRVQTVNTPASGPAVTTNDLVDTGGGLSQVVAETDGGGNLVAYYVRAGDQLLSVMRPGGPGGMWTTRFVHEDGLGSVRATTDETGSVVDTRGYEAFGTKNSEAGTDPLAYGFAGEPLDSTTHLAYHRARWMDSRVGRFAGMDAADSHDDDPATVNRYAYSGDDPPNMSDPSGEDFDLGSIGAALVIVSISATTATPAYAKPLATASSAGTSFFRIVCANTRNSCFDTNLARQLEIAQTYLDLSWTAKQLFQYIGGSPIEIEWTLATGAMGSHINPNTGAIVWDPVSAAEYPRWDSKYRRNQRNSPAVVLIHEMGHYLFPTWGEQQIMDYWEFPTARELRLLSFGEGLRRSHSEGTWIPVLEADDVERAPGK